MNNPDISQNWQKNSFTTVNHYLDFHITTLKIILKHHSLKQINVKKLVRPCPKNPSPRSTICLSVSLIFPVSLELSVKKIRNILPKLWTSYWQLIGYVARTLLNAQPSSSNLSYIPALARNLTYPLCILSYMKRCNPVHSSSPPSD